MNEGETGEIIRFNGTTVVRGVNWAATYLIMTAALAPLAALTTPTQAQTAAPSAPSVPSAHAAQKPMPKSSYGASASSARDSAATIKADVVRHLPERFRRLKQGMTEEQVFKTLGMPPHGYSFGGRGSGPIHAYIQAYRVGPYSMGLVWDGHILKSGEMYGGLLNAGQTVPPTEQQGHTLPTGGIVVIDGKQVQVPPGGHIIYGPDTNPVRVATPPPSKPSK